MTTIKKKVICPPAILKIAHTDTAATTAADLSLGVRQHLTLPSATSPNVAETHLVSKMLDDESTVGHARLLEEGAGLQVGVVEFLSP